MKKQFVLTKKSLTLKKQKIVGLTISYCGDGTDTTHQTTNKTTTTGDADAIMVAYLTM